MTTFEDIMIFSPENQKVFDELAGLCIKRLIVPYIGAGMSVFAGFKTWNNFIKEEYEKWFQKKPDDMDNIVAADLIEKKQKKDSFYENVRTSFGGNLNDADWKTILEKAENQAISVIPKLFSGPIVTTNFDQIIEKTHKNEFPVVFPYNSEELEKAVDSRKRLIYKIHGCVSDTQKIVFTKSVYDEVYSPNSELVKSLSSFFQGFHFLFLGSSLGVSNGKEDTKDYSMDLWEKLQISGTYHFAILDCKKDQLTTRRNELEERNIHPILFESGKFESVKIILDELLKIVETNSLNIPKYKTSYIERKDSIIERINNRLDERNFAVLALTGMGGVGKTRILSEYAKRQKDESKYLDIVWINAISAVNVREEIRSFLEKKGIKIDEKDPNQIFTKFRQWMNDNENWLFVLDNVDNYEDIELFFDCNQALARKRHILISSRLDADKLPNIPILPIDIFTPEDALNFLHRYTNKGTDEYAGKIAERLGWLPLALEQTAAYIKETDETYQGYFEMLEKEPLILLEKIHPEPGAVSVRATWNISMQRIKNESARQLLYVFAYFAPDNISKQWFKDANNVLPNKLREVTAYDLQYQKVIVELTKYSLITLDDKGNISIHRLVQEVIRDSHKKNEQDKWRNYCVKVLNKLHFSDFSTTESRNLFLNLSTHIHSVTNAFSNKIANKEVSNLYYFLGLGYYKLAEFNKALEYYRKDLVISKKVIGKEHPDTASTYNDIGEVYRAMGTYDLALEYHKKAKAIREKVLGKKHPSTAQTYNNIALVYSNQGDYDKALEYYRKDLAICEKVLGNEPHPDTATTYINIAEVYDKQGDYDKALEYCGKALAIGEKVLGKEHLLTAATYNNIAGVYDKQGNYDKALEYNLKTLSICEKVLGEEHPDTATIYNNIAVVNIKL